MILDGTTGTEKHLMAAKNTTKQPTKTHHDMTQKITVLTYVVYKFLKLRVKELFVKRGDLDAYIKLDEEYERLDILFDKTFKSRK
jgi:hypothetical protein